MTKHLRLDQAAYQKLHQKILERDGWRCQFCGAREQLQVHHIDSRAQLGPDTEENLITLCATCHRAVHLK